MFGFQGWFSNLNKRQKIEENPEIPSLEPRKEVYTVKTERETVERNVQVNVKNLLEKDSDFVIVAELAAGDTIGLPSSWQYWVKRFTENDKKTVVGLYLRCLSRAKYVNVSLNATFVATLLHPEDRKKNIVYEAVPQNFSAIDSWGMRKFIEGNKLDEYMNNDSEISLHLRFTLQNSKQERDIFNDMEDQSVETWRLELLNEFRGGNHKDIQVTSTKCKMDPIWANKVVLAGRSKYFRNIIEDIKEGRPNGMVVMRGNHPVVSVDISQDALLHLMCHIYHGYLNENLINPEKCSAETARELATAAAEHELLYLEQYLMQFHPGLKEQDSPDELMEEEGEVAKKDAETGEQKDAETGDQKEAETFEQKEAETGEPKEATEQAEQK